MLAGVAAIAAVGCGAGDDPGETGDAPQQRELATPESLTGKTFVSTNVKGEELAPGTKITMSFGHGTLTASAGCNTLRGPIEFQEDGAFNLGKAAGTLLGCPDELKKQDEWLTSVLTLGVRPYYEDDGNLTLLSLGAEIEMEEGTVPGGAPPVVGTTWELNSYDAPNGSVASVKQGVRLPYIRFDQSGKFELFDGCNQGGGEAEIKDDGTIVFGLVHITEMVCPGLSADVSNAMTKVLSGKTFYAFEGQNLVITRKGSSLTFTPG